MEVPNNMEVPKEIESRMKYFLESEKYKFWPVFLNIPIDSRRSNAATKVIKMIKNDFDQQRSDEEHCDEDEDDDDVSRDDGTELRENLERFITALQDAPMILGFHAVETHADANVCCYCPCSKKLKVWRDHHDLEIPLCGDGKTAQKYSPNALVAHLKVLSQPTVHSNGTAAYHRVALKYIEALYENYWGVGIHHKGLYNLNDKGYNKASNEEKSRDVETMNRLRDELEKTQIEKMEADKRANRWEKIQKINPDLLALKQKYEKKMDLLVKLGLAVRTESGSVEIIGKKQKPLTETEIKRYETQHACFIKLWNFEFENKIGSRKATLQVTFDDTKERPSDNNTKGSPIDAWFRDNTNSDLKSLFGDTNIFLFGDVLMNDKGIYGDFFNPWEIQFQCITIPATTAAKRVKTEHGNYSHPIDISEENYEMVATDSGGPTRSFLMKLWTELITVTVKLHEDGQPKKLFVDIGEYIVPTIDVRTQTKARPIYRAIGRIMSYCILHKELIANHVVPDIYKNYLFRDVTPLDIEYELSDLVNNYTEMMKLKNSSADHDENIDIIFRAYAISDEKTIEKNADGLLAQVTDDMPPKERMFREFINNEYFKPRRIALDAMKQGIRLQVALKPNESDFVPCEKCFSTMPIEAVRKLLFDYSGYDIDFVLGHMQRVSVPPDDVRDEEVLRNMQETQDIVFRVNSQNREGLLVEILRQKCKDNEEFIRDFVWYLTGSKYIRQSEFEIKVEFNGDETNFDWLPIVHTCENTIKLPALAYFGNAEILERNLDIAMKSAQACAFDMA